jgi:hypothetical protein
MADPLSFDSLLAGNPAFALKAYAEAVVHPSLRADSWNADFAALALECAAQHNAELKSLAERMGGAHGLLERAAQGQLTDDEKVILSWFADPTAPD